MAAFLPVEMLFNVLVVGLPALIGGAAGFAVAQAIDHDVVATLASAGVALAVTVIAGRLIDPDTSRELVARVQAVAGRRGSAEAA